MESSCFTSEGVMSHTHARIMSHLKRSDVTHMEESCQNLCTQIHAATHGNTLQHTATHDNNLQHTSRTHRVVMSRIRTSRVTICVHKYMASSFILNIICARTSRVTRVGESCHTHARITSHFKRSDGTHMEESCHNLCT